MTGVVSLCEGSKVDSDALREFTRSRLAAFKLPKQLVLVDEVRRAANGKADYVWARKTVEEALG